MEDSEQQDPHLQPRIFGLRKNIFFLGFTSLLNDFSSEMVYSVFPVFFTTVLRSGAASLGLVDGIADGLSNLFKLYSGNLSDRFQKRKPLVVLGYTLSVLARPFYVLASSVGGVLVLRVIDRMGKGFRDAPRDAILSLSAPKEELGVSFGYHRAMDTTGAILGPLGAYMLLRYFPGSFNTVFVTAFFIGLLALSTLVFISDVTVARPRRITSLLRSFKELPPQFGRYLLSLFLLSMGTMPIAVMLLKPTSIGLLIASVPLFYMLYNVSYAAFSIGAGKLSDRIGSKTVMIAGYLVLILSYALLAGAASTVTLALGFLTLGLFPALTDGVSRAFASKLTAEENRGSAMGTLQATTGFGALFAGVLGGYLWQSYGPSIALTVASGMILLGLGIFASVQSDT